jgi:predicted  nucleic acid-binding Zn-ribbon protein
MKESVYEWENKNTDIELQMEDMKTQLQNEKDTLTKNLRKSQENEKDITRKLEQLKKKYDQEVVEAS